MKKYSIIFIFVFILFIGCYKIFFSFSPVVAGYVIDENNQKIANAKIVATGYGALDWDDRDIFTVETTSNKKGKFELKFSEKVENINVVVTKENYLESVHLDISQFFDNKIKLRACTKTNTMFFVDGYSTYYKNASNKAPYLHINFVVDGNKKQLNSINNIGYNFDKLSWSNENIKPHIWIELSPKLKYFKEIFALRTDSKNKYNPRFIYNPKIILKTAANIKIAPYYFNEYTNNEITNYELTEIPKNKIFKNEHMIAGNEEGFFVQIVKPKITYYAKLIYNPHKIDTRESYYTRPNKAKITYIIGYQYSAFVQKNGSKKFNECPK